MNGLWLIVFLIIAPYLIAKLDIWRSRQLSAVRQWWAEENMPEELKSATIFLCESDITASKPVALHGRVDQVYQTKDKVLIPLDTKSRSTSKVFMSDVIQLSVYAMILKQNFKFEVASYGYVRTVVSQNNVRDKVRYIKTDLLSDSEIIRLHRRYSDIHLRKVTAKCTCSGKLHKNK